MYLYTRVSYLSWRHAPNSKRNSKLFKLYRRRHTVFKVTPINGCCIFPGENDIILNEFTWNNEYWEQ